MVNHAPPGSFALWDQDDNSPSADRLIRLAALILSTALSACAANKEPIESPPTIVQEGRTAEEASSYEHVARRKLGTVALAESRGLAAGEGAEITEQIASALERCAEGLVRDRHLAKGAMRVAARIDAAGHLGGMEVRMSPGDDVARNGILCVLTPLRSLSFSSAAPGIVDRGFALEAIWQPPSETR